MVMTLGDLESCLSIINIRMDKDKDKVYNLPDNHLVSSGADQSAMMGIGVGMQKPKGGIGKNEKLSYDWYVSFLSPEFGALLIFSA
jgi:hypothetical protein